jgi:hypothetical protein
MKSLRPVVLVATLLALVPVFLPASDLHAVPQQAPDRSAPPKPGAPPAFKPPVIEKRTLSNGLPVWVVELHKVPVVHVSLVVKAGSGIDPKGKYGIASLTADMLDEGAGSRDALQIADAIDYLGANLSTDSTSDATSIDLHVPVARLGDALPIMADVALRPTFPEDELKRVREELLTSLIEAQDDPESLIQFAFPRLVFGTEHRYGTLSMGTAATVKALSAADLRQFHAQHYAPSDSLLIVTGDVTAADAATRLERAFGTWKAAAGSHRAGTNATHVSPDLSHRQTWCGTVSDSHRVGWRSAIDAGFLRAARAQHDPRRLLHVPVESESPRGARLRIRSGIDIRHARRSRPFLRLRRCADR